MSSNSSNNKRVAKNTMFMYFRMLILLVIGLYTSRVVLASLGISDYGLYNVVGGIVTLFAFLNGALSTGTQRFLNFELGRGDKERLNLVFRTSFTQHIVLIALVLVLAETIGLWFVTNKLNIEPGRENAALWVYQTSIFVLCTQIFQIPYMSAIIAHEKMSFYAYFSIIEAVLKLSVAYLLTIWNVDKLILYGILILIVHIFTASLYCIYSTYKFSEARAKFAYQKEMFRLMLSFSGWNLFGGFCSISNNQGVNIIMNLYFGTVINAARGLAFQVSSIVSQFVTNFQVAVRPQVVKYYANGELEQAENLVMNSAKFSAFLLIIIAVPLMTEIETVLELWLGEYPDNTPLFLSLVLINSIFYSMVSSTLMIVHASGKVKEVSVWSGLTYLSILPISYLMFEFGFPAYSVFVINIGAVIIDQCFELYWMKRHIGFPTIKFFKIVYGRVLPILCISIATSFVLHYILIDVNPYIRLFTVVPCSVIFISLMIYSCGLDKGLRTYVKNLIKIRHAK